MGVRERVSVERPVAPGLALVLALPPTTPPPPPLSGAAAAGVNVRVGRGGVGVWEGRRLALVMSVILPLGVLVRDFEGEGVRLSGSDKLGEEESTAVGLWGGWEGVWGGCGGRGVMMNAMGCPC